MVGLRGIEGRRGWLAAGVAAVFLLGVALLGYRAAAIPPSAPLAAAPTPVPPGPAVPAVPPAPGPAAPGAPNAPAPNAAAPQAGDPKVAPNDAGPDAGAPAGGSLAEGPLDMVPANVAKRLRTDGFTVALRASGAVTDCVANSYGQTQEFLRGNPCAGLQRALLVVHGPGPGEALVSLAWVRMPTATSASALRSVLDRPGSGNVNALAEGAAFTGQFYASRVTGAVAVNADVHPTAPGLSPADLRKIALDALG